MWTNVDVSQFAALLVAECLSSFLVLLAWELACEQDLDVSLFLVSAI